MSYQAFLDSLTESTDGDKLRAVNDYFNQQIEYKRDRKDHWQTLGETLERGKGDCEDIAIAKFFTLLNLGFEEDELLLILGWNGFEYHVVLLHRGVNEPEGVVLDNICQEIRATGWIDGFQPLIAFNSKERYRMDGWKCQLGNFLMYHWERVLSD